MSKNINSYYRNLLKEQVRNRCMQRLSEETKPIPPLLKRPGPGQYGGNPPVNPPGPPAGPQGGGSQGGPEGPGTVPGRWRVKPFDPSVGDPRLPFHPVYNPGGYLTRPPGWSGQNPSRVRPPLPVQPDFPGWGGMEPYYPWAPWNWNDELGDFYPAHEDI